MKKVFKVTLAERVRQTATVYVEADEAIDPAELAHEVYEQADLGLLDWEVNWHLGGEEGIHRIEAAPEQTPTFRLTEEGRLVEIDTP